jgi:hypothetical protein
VEAVFNTLLEDEELLRLLFSLLDQDPPLSCKAAGYFGRVVGQLLLRKTNEMMQHLSHNDEILEKLIKHVDTTSIADIIKRLVGADDHSSMIFSPMHTQWLADTPLVTMLLDRLGPMYTTHVQVCVVGLGTMHLTAIGPWANAATLLLQHIVLALCPLFSPACTTPTMQQAESAACVAFNHWLAHIFQSCSPTAVICAGQCS